MHNKVLNEFLFHVNLENIDPYSFILFFQEHEVFLNEKLKQAGAIKFHGVKIQSIEDFQEVVSSISNKFLDYVDGNSPRTKLLGNIYTSTEYDKTQKITLHNELSYSEKWPKKLFFTCIEPALSGGETLLVDSREIVKHMDKEIIEEIDRKGITYIRNLHGGTGIGPSWQDTFEINDKNQLDVYLRHRDVDFRWKENNGLHIRQHREGILAHGTRKERSWFNQIDQFHPYHLGDEIYETMTLMYQSPEHFPMYVTYGDGTEIGDETVKAIISTIDELTHYPKWEKNELLIIDNEVVGHGRNSFTGERKVLVAMAE